MQTFFYSYADKRSLDNTKIYIYLCISADASSLKEIIEKGRDIDVRLCSIIKKVMVDKCIDEKITYTSWQVINETTTGGDYRLSECRKRHFHPKEILKKRFLDILQKATDPFTDFSELEKVEKTTQILLC